jgi:catechol 2,3-dioxygenase
MTHEAIDPGTAIGAVHLTVCDLARSTDFYVERLGFKVGARGDGAAHLGAGGADLLVLWERPDARRVRGTTGLYHFAILVPSRRELANSLAHLLVTRTPLTGVADHRVSEALYLSDPEDNGIEIYRDRPRSEWPFEGSEVRMATDPLDLDSLYAERSESAEGGEPWAGLAPATTIGHVHLHVARLDEAQRFYVGVLGFDLMQRFGSSALFVSAGGYHHHVGLNTWSGIGAPPPPPDASGLRHFVLRLPRASARDKVIARVRGAGTVVEEVEGGFALGDPFANRIVLAVDNGRGTSGGGRT